MLLYMNLYEAPKQQNFVGNSDLEILFSKKLQASMGRSKAVEFRVEFPARNSYHFSICRVV